MTLRTLSPRVPTHAKKQTNAQLSQQEWLRHAAAATPAELFCELNSGEEGLRAGQVDEARAFWGANATAQAAKRPAPLRLLASFADPFTYILVFIALVSVLTDWVFADAGSRDVTTPLIIGVMVMVSGVLRFVQNEKSTVAAESLAEMIETLANVERDGDGGNPIPLDEVVVGDVVHLSSGDVVPADLRIFAARDLFVSQSSLTGESEPVEKRASLANPGAKGGTPADCDGACALTDLADLAFMGSTVISGNARGVVVATGARTMFGEATGTLAGRKRQTAFDEGIHSTSRLLMHLMAIMLPIVLVICGITKGDWLAALLFWVCPAVAGGAWWTLDAAGQALFAGTFQAGWFIESMWTQTLVVHLIRTTRVPFAQSRACGPLLGLGTMGVAAVTALPFSPIGAALDFRPLPAGYFALLACVVAGYAASVLFARRRFVRRHGELL